MQLSEKPTAIMKPSPLIALGHKEVLLSPFRNLRIELYIFYFISYKNLSSFSKKHQRKRTGWWVENNLIH